MQEVPDWRVKPRIIDEIDLNNTSITHIAFLDENGDPYMNHIIKAKRNNTEINENSKYFALTSVLYDLKDLASVRDSFINIKSKYWPESGTFKYPKSEEMKVCFHSKEIRDRQGPFSDNAIDYDTFIEDLSEIMTNLPVSINTSFINKENHYLRYRDFAISPYIISLTFILERILTRILRDSDELILVLEARGKNEDMAVLQHLMIILSQGTNYVSYRQFAKIKGVYFNRKRSANNTQSYYGLETADLCAHPIYRYCISNNKNRAFISIEPKIHGYPNYYGKGIKKFP